MKTVKILTLEKDLNDATSYYIDIVKEAIKHSGNSYVHISDAKEIKSGDVVLVITLKAFFKSLMSFRKFKCIMWYQGALVEEIDMYDIPKWKKGLSKFLYRILEKKSLKENLLNIFVSDAMATYFKRYSNYKGNNHFIMPCFNQSLLSDAFKDDKYEKPTFLYTGTLANWQCFEPMLKLFKKIKNQIPDASLTVYIEDHLKAQQILDANGVQAELKYVPYQVLAEEIKKFKYGFLIREDNLVNKVATPTKMNSYLASGIIPVYSTVVDSFQDNLQELRYSVPLDEQYNGLNKLFQLEKEKIKGENILKDFTKVFETYYNREKYISSLTKIFKDALA